MAERIPAKLLGEWAAFERLHGPLLIHERIDWQTAVVATALMGGGQVADNLPPWYRKGSEQLEDGLGEALSRLADKWKAKEG